MKKLFSYVAIAATCLSLASCGVATTTSNNITETRIELSSNNFKVVGQAYGESKATYICGIGGLRKKTLRANAIDEMSKNANLHGAQTLTNVTTHISVKMITPLYIEYTCSATANIIEFQ